MRRSGRRGGTFVSEPKIERDLTALAGLTAQLRRQGHRAGARVLSAEEGPAGGRTAAALGAGAGRSRVRGASGSGSPTTSRSPWSDRCSRPPGSPGCSTAPLDGSLYEVLEERYGDGPVRAVERLEPVVAEAARRSCSTCGRARRSCSWSGRPSTGEGMPDRVRPRPVPRRSDPGRRGERRPPDAAPTPRPGSREELGPGRRHRRRGGRRRRSPTG